MGWGDGYTTNVGYNQNSGIGMGYGINGTPNMYYPGYDYNKPEKSANRALYEAQLNYQKQQKAINNVDPSLAIAGVGTTTLSELYYSKTYNTWMGRNYKMYEQSWGGNKYTGGKNKYGKKMSNIWKWAGRGIAVANAYDNWHEHSQGRLANDRYYIEQVSNVLSTYGPLGGAWSIGWESGRLVTHSEWYQERKYNFFYDKWEQKYGKPSTSNEWIWNYFYKNYRP